jgi:hypothetical protein
LTATGSSLLIVVDELDLVGVYLEESSTVDLPAVIIEVAMFALDVETELGVVDSLISLVRTTIRVAEYEKFWPTLLTEDVLLSDVMTDETELSALVAFALDNIWAVEVEEPAVVIGSDNVLAYDVIRSVEGVAADDVAEVGICPNEARLYVTVRAGVVAVTVTSTELARRFVAADADAA